MDLKSTSKPGIRLLISLLILLSGAYLIFKNLDRSYLWQDEAETACIARTIPVYGIPKGYDGLNYFTQEQGAELGKHNEWKLTPWLQFYTEEASFAIFGQSVFAARLPFALFGLASLLLFFFLCLELRPDLRFAVLAMLMLLLCVPFLLLVRQARYYPLAIFFQIASVFFYVRYLHGRKFSLVLLLISLLLLFQSHYLFALTFLPATVIHAFFYSRPALKKLLLTYALFLIISIPILLWLSDTPYSHRYGAQLLNPGHIVEMAGYYFRDIFIFIFSPVLLVLLLINFIGKDKKPLQRPSDSVALILILLAANLTALSILSLEHYYRYLGPLLPLFILLAAFLIYELKRFHPVLPWIAAAVYIFYMNPLGKYFYELQTRTPYIGPESGMVDYFRQNLKPSDTLAVSYGDLPLKFAFPDYKIYGGLSAEPLKRASHAQWIVLRRNPMNEHDRGFINYLRAHVNGNDYTGVKLDVPDVPFENRESPSEHYYRSPAGDYPVIIFKRKY
jgi:hypothetical protein